MKTIFTFSTLIMALISLTGCVTFGPKKAPVKSDSYYCEKSGKNIKTTLFDDGSLDLEYFNLVVSLQPTVVTVKGGTYKNKQMVWDIKGQTAVLSSADSGSQLDTCKLSRASSIYNSVESR